MSGANDRFFPSTWLQPLPCSKGQLNKMVISSSLAQELVRVQNRIESKYSPKIAMEHGDYSVYTGAGGIAYMYWRLSLMENSFIADSREQLLDKASNYVDVALRLKPKSAKAGRASTFLNGMAGVYAVAAAIYFAKNETTKVDLMHRELLNLACTCATMQCPSELMTGRAGYLSCLLFVAANSGFHLANAGQIVSDTIHLILEDGRSLATAGFPLMWEWHEKKYLGAAHGLCGILLMLLYYKNVVQAFGYEQMLKQTIDQLVRIRFPSGNLPSSLGSETDRLVHWCHGAPGFIPLMCTAHATYNEPQYLDTAMVAAQVVKERGLLKKGFGLCHGIGGNGLALLAVYRATKKEEYLHEALRFALFACNADKIDGSGGGNLKRALEQTPDRPYSLFEGLGGLACFLAALLDPPDASHAARVTGPGAPFLM